jgi:hypothetical protein
MKFQVLILIASLIGKVKLIEYFFFKIYFWFKAYSNALSCLNCAGCNTFNTLSQTCLINQPYCYVSNFNIFPRRSLEFHLFIDIN